MPRPKRAGPSIDHEAKRQLAKNYVGVAWHKTNLKFRAAIQYQERDIHLGYYACPETAAWAVDFARYLLHGLDSRAWHHKTGRANFSPHLRDDIPRSDIVGRLLRQDAMPPDDLRERLGEFLNSCASK